MSLLPDSTIRSILRAASGAVFLGIVSIAMAQDVPIVQPGAPGESARGPDGR